MSERVKTSVLRWSGYAVVAVAVAVGKEGYDGAVEAAVEFCCWYKGRLNAVWVCEGVAAEA